MKNKIHEKEKLIKFLDLVIRDIENVEYFNIKEDINKYRDIDDHEKEYLPYSIESIGKTYNLFEDTLNTSGWLKLTTKGIELKEYGKGFNKFESRLKRRLSTFEKVSVFFLIIGFVFGIYQFEKNQSLENHVSTLENRLNKSNLKIDSLTSQSLHQKNLIKQLSFQRDSLCVELPKRKQ